MSEAEEVLLVRAVGGDTEALSALLLEHGPTIERGLRIDRAWQAVLEPGDVMQITYLEAFLRIGCFDPQRSEPFASWLRRIAENNLKDAIRGLERQKRPQPQDRIQPGSDSASWQGLIERLGVSSTTLSRQVEQDEAHQALEKAIDALPDDYAAVVREYDLQGRSIGEVAAALVRSPGAVHMLRARAHDRLRELLRSSSEFFGSSA